MGVIKEDRQCEGVDFMGEEPPQQICFPNDIYMDGYQNYVPRKQKIAKAARKWKASANKPKEFKFSANIDQSKPPEGVFMFGSAARKVPSNQELTRNQVNTVKKPSRWSRFGKFKVETKKAQGADHMGNTAKKRRGSILIPRKINPYELRDQELKIEQDKRAKRKFLNWKRRQQQNSIRTLKC